MTTTKLPIVTTARFAIGGSEPRQRRRDGVFEGGVGGTFELIIFTPKCEFMALDGTKIIDGDLAHDVYNDFMDWYDEGLAIADIKLKVFRKYHYGSSEDWDFEILFTVLTLALWETGNLTKLDIEDLKLVVKKGAGVRFWEEFSNEDGRTREKVLNSFIAKVSKPKTKPRQRKKYQKIRNFHFRKGDVIAYYSMNGTWRVSIVNRIEQYRNKCTYHFSQTTFQGLIKPTTNDLLKEKLFFTKVGCPLDSQKFISQRPILKKMYEKNGLENKGFYLGTVVMGVEHKCLGKFKESFELIGSVELNVAFNERGSFGFCDTFEQFMKHNEYRYESNRYELVPLELVLQEG